MILFRLYGRECTWYLQTDAYFDLNFLAFMAKTFGGQAYTA